MSPTCLQRIKEPKGTDSSILMMISEGNCRLSAPKVFIEGITAGAAKRLRANMMFKVKSWAFPVVDNVGTYLTIR